MEIFREVPRSSNLRRTPLNSPNASAHLFGLTPTASATATAASAFRTLNAPSKGRLTSATPRFSCRTLNLVESLSYTTSTARQFEPGLSPNVSTGALAYALSAEASSSSPPSNTRPLAGTTLRNLRNVARTASKSS